METLPTVIEFLVTPVVDAFWPGSSLDGDGQVVDVLRPEAAPAGAAPSRAPPPTTSVPVMSVPARRPRTDAPAVLAPRHNRLSVIPTASPLLVVTSPGPTGTPGGDRQALVSD